MTSIHWSRTDLIDESDEVVKHKTKGEKEALKENEGIEFKETTYKRVQITKVSVTEEAEKEIQKKAGEYFTLTVPTLTISDDQGMQQLQRTIINTLDELFEKIEQKAEKILIIGLGNKTITPDAIGPFTIDSLQKEYLEEGVDNFMLFAPGVTAQTNYETGDFIQALAEKIKPTCIVVIDALATRATNRLCKTVQITNTGIHPGSGVGNKRKEISESTIGIPVIAIGIPTVVGGPVVVSDAIDRVFHYIATKIHEKELPSSKLSVTPYVSDKPVDISVTQSVFGEWVNWSKEEREQLLNEVLVSNVDSLIVTPKEIDIWIIQFSLLLTNSLLEWGKKLQKNN